MLLVIVIVTYGYQVFEMGYYQDDWEFIYSHGFESNNINLSFFLHNRPAVGWFYLFLIPILGIKPYIWHLFIILIRWLSLTGFWWSFRMIWPRRIFEIAWILALMAVYPAFSQHSASITYMPYFFSLALFAFSLGLNVLSIKKTSWWPYLTFTSILLSIFRLVLFESFLELELLRPLFIWIVLLEKHKAGKKIWHQLWKQWCPYLAVFLVYLFYLLFWLPKYLPVTQNLTPVWSQLLVALGPNEIVKFANRVLQDMIFINIESWLAPLDPGNINLLAKANWLSWGFGLILTLIFGWLTYQLSKKIENSENKTNHFALSLVLIGIIGVFLASLPIWLDNYQSIRNSQDGHFFIGSMLGSTFFLMGCSYWFARTRIKLSILLGIVLGFSLASQMQTVNKYRLNWSYQRDYYWQMAWRAPGIKKGTAVVGLKLPIGYANNDHIGYALNQMFYPNQNSFDLPIWFFQADTLLKKKDPELKTVFPMDYSFPGNYFSGSMDQIIITDYSEGGSCLHVITSEDLLIDDLSSNQQKLYRLSDQHWIDLHPSQNVDLSEEIFGTEPPHGWCYYYQMIERSLQENDWETASNLADMANEEGLVAKRGREYTPIILAYIRTNQLEKAVQTTIQGEMMDKDLAKYFCSLWASENQKSTGLSDTYSEIKTLLTCE